MLSPLTAETIKNALTTLPGWSEGMLAGKKCITCRIEFEDFLGAMQFMHGCVEGIQQRNHHPVWTNKFNVVEIWLNTFDVGHVVTEKDIELAKFFVAILAEYGSDFKVME